MKDCVKVRGRTGQGWTGQAGQGGAQASSQLTGKTARSYPSHGSHDIDGIGDQRRTLRVGTCECGRSY